MEIFLGVDTWVLLLTLTFLEIVLGIDNIIFISILANKLPREQRSKVTVTGLIFAMLQRIILLFFVTSLMKLQKPFLSIDISWLQLDINGQSLVLLGGGIFLLYKSTSEIFEKTEEKDKYNTTGKARSLWEAIFQILLIDFVFSIDSILTAVGMTTGAYKSTNESFVIMAIAVIISIIIMISFVNIIRRFINRHPSIQVLGLAFLILIGFMLIIEAAHSSQAIIFGTHVQRIPKGYLYFAISFSLFVELLIIKKSEETD